MRLLLLSITLTVAWGCGPLSSNYVPYRPLLPDTTNCKEARSAFSSIERVINANCSQQACHGGNAGGLTLLPDLNDQNRQNLKNRPVGLNAAALYQKIGLGQGHSGGGAKLPLRYFEAWVKAETGCN